MATQEPGIPEAIERQAAACAALGSAQYATLLPALRLDYETGGLTHELLHDRPEAPLRDAITLRYLAAVHRVVLRGDAPALSKRYPSVGGDGTPIPIDDFLAVVDSHRAEIVEGLGQNVQTNEVGRCAALLPAFAQVARTTRLPLNMLEVGASGGLLSNWDCYWYDCFGNTFGDTSSTVRFTDRWVDPFDLSGLTPVLHRGACDISPLDITDPGARVRLLSFVWPDHIERFTLLFNALEIAKTHPPNIDAADAGSWLAGALPQRPSGTATVVFHSIVWQYMARPTKDRFREVLHEEAKHATPDRPIAWARLEPTGALADVRLTIWPGAHEQTIAISSHHGANIARPD